MDYLHCQVASFYARELSEEVKEHLDSHYSARGTTRRIQQTFEGWLQDPLLIEPVTLMGYNQAGTQTDSVHGWFLWVSRFRHQLFPNSVPPSTQVLPCTPNLWSLSAKFCLAAITLTFGRATLSASTVCGFRQTRMIDFSFTMYGAV